MLCGVFPQDHYLTQYLRSHALFALIFMLCHVSRSLGEDPVSGSRAKYLILVTLDGVRGDEMFGGMDLETLKASSEGKDVRDQEVYQRFWASTPEERRLNLMPFFWGTLMKQHGFILGHRQKGSIVQLRNRHRFSYPGYAEILTGRARDRIIKSNEKVRNPSPTLLEFLKSEWQLKFQEVAAFASWETMDFIVQQQKGAIYSNAGHQTYISRDPVMRWLSKAQFQTRSPWDSVRHDYYTFTFAMDYVQHRSPRVLYLALGETDDWAHDGRYDRVLQALHQSDQYLRVLWEYYQSRAETKGRTCFVMTTDHGRGGNPYNWMHHNDKLEESQYTWLSVACPGLTRRGELMEHPPVFAEQIAATTAMLMGLNYVEKHPNAGKSIPFLNSVP